MNQEKHEGLVVISDLEYCHPEDYEMENDEEFFDISNESSEQEIYSCDACDRYFPYKEVYEKHMSQHRVCNLDGCTFSAHEKIVENHIRLQHSTGLYDKIRNINTPEDISKWIEERKKNYPNKSNVQMKRQEQEERSKRGDRIMKRKSRFRENKSRLTKTRNGKKVIRLVNTKKKKVHPKVKLEKPLINTEKGWNNMFPFKGTFGLYNEEIEVEENKYEDEEWSTSVSSNPVMINNSLGALMGAYMSGDESDDGSVPVQDLSSNKLPQRNAVEVTRISDEHVVETINEDGPPTEIKIEKTQTNIVENLNNNPRVSRKRRNIKIGKNKGNMSHKKPAYTFKKRRVTLLEKLLDNDIRKERNVLLQGIRYVINNNFFDKSNLAKE